MTLEQNPFKILGVSSRHGRREILSAARERSLLVDEQSVREAKSVLLHPVKRIAAEVAWLPSVEPDYVTRLLRTLRSDPIQIRLHRGLSDLAQANLLAEALGHLAADVSTEELAQWIVSVSVIYDSISLESTVDLVNSDRRTAGFPLISRSDVVRAELDDRRRHYRKAIQAVLDRRSVSVVAHALTLAVEATTSGDRHAPVLLDDLVDRFEEQYRSSFENRIAEIEQLCGMVLKSVSDLRSSDEVRSRVADLIVAVKSWDALAQPSQVSARSRGLSHTPSLRVARMIRSLAIRLHNDHGLTVMSVLLVELTLEVFAEVDSVVEESEEDAKTLDRIIRTHGNTSRIGPPTTGTDGPGARIGRPWPPTPDSLSGLRGTQGDGQDGESESESGGCGCLLFLVVLVIAAVLAICGSSRDRAGDSSEETFGAPRVRESIQTGSAPGQLEPQLGGREQDIQDATTPSYTRPSVGGDRRLSISEIRWCLREDIRLEAIRVVVSLDADVDRFNELVRDYNSRCASFRYREGSLEAARRYVESYRDQVEMDAVQGFSSD